MRCDFHLHSRCSDGSDTMEELFQRCRDRGLEAVALTDHDRVDHLDRAEALATSVGLSFVRGVEISAAGPEGFPGAGRKVHLLGLFLQQDASAIEALCAPIRHARHAQSLRQADILRTVGYELPPQELADACQESGVLYKQHLMEALIKRGQADGQYGEVYRKLFKAGGPLTGDITYAHPFEAIRAIRASGGIAVLAHPGLYDNWDLVPALVEAGLGGIEVDHPSLGPNDQARSQALVSQFGLFASGGSDWHGSYGDEGPPGSHGCTQGPTLMKS